MTTVKNCDCADRSWYGTEHDSACVLSGQPFENFLTRMRERQDTEGQAGDSLPELCGICHVKVGDQCQCKTLVGPSDFDKAIEAVEQVNHIARYPVKVYCSASGSTAVFSKGEQVAEAQQPWILDIARNIEKAGLDPVDAEVILPDGRKAYFFRTEEELNWRIENVG